MPRLQLRPEFAERDIGQLVGAKRLQAVAADEGFSLAAIDAQRIWVLCSGLPDESTHEQLLRVIQQHTEVVDGFSG